MREGLRSLLPVVLLGLTCTAVLVIWIRAEPLAMPRALQLLVSIGLVAALAALVVVVLRVEREDDIDKSGGVTNGCGSDMQTHAC